jgi:hypothetical protein
VEPESGVQESVLVKWKQEEEEEVKPAPNVIISRLEKAMMPILQKIRENSRKNC